MSHSCSAPGGQSVWTRARTHMGLGCSCCCWPLHQTEARLVYSYTLAAGVDSGLEAIPTL